MRIDRLVRATSRAVVTQSHWGSGGTGWIYPNKYNSPCIRCRKAVAPGEGEYRHDGTRWVVRHSGGRCHTPEYTRHVTERSPEWLRIRDARLAYARHHCEWKPWFSKRCPVRFPLQAHHRHYRTLGHETLPDLVVLCKPHHAIADDRRRFWGAYPLIPRPFFG